MVTLAVTIFKNRVTLDGTSLVYLRLTHKEKSRYISLGYKVKAEAWNPTKKRYVKPASEHASRFNYLINEDLNRARNILLDLEWDNVPINYQNFLNRFRPFSEKMFIPVVFEEIDKKIESKVISPGAAKVYRYAAKRFRKEVGDLKISEITSDVVKLFKEKVKSTNSENTANT